MKKIGIFGSTGIVGRTVIKILNERKLFDYKYFLFANSTEPKRSFKIGKQKYIVQGTDFENLPKLDFALLCTREEVSKQLVEKLSKNNCTTIDFSSYFRKDFPLIVPEINFENAQGNIICNPNCSTIASVMALYEINKKFGLESIVYSTYQAVSGAGKLALDDIKTKDVKKLKNFKFPIYNNLIPQIGSIDKQGFSTEENKMMFETRKILNDPKIKITATCVRVPIDICHCISIHFKTRKNVSLSKIKDTLSQTKGVKIFDDEPNYPMPYFTRHQSDVLVGRIRESFDKNSFDIFVCSDNLRKGAAQNGVQILEGFLNER